jgi:hypothetical protein
MARSSLLALVSCLNFDFSLSACCAIFRSVSFNPILSTWFFLCGGVHPLCGRAAGRRTASSPRVPPARPQVQNLEAALSLSTSSPSPITHWWPPIYHRLRITHPSPLTEGHFFTTFLTDWGSPPSAGRYIVVSGPSPRNPSHSPVTL